MTPRFTPLGLAALVLASACTVEEPPAEETEITQDLVTLGIITTRGVNTTANVLADWGNDRQISAALVTAGTLKVRYCAQHFPAGSQALANLRGALAAYSGVAGIAIDITDIAAEPGTAVHPNLATFALPADSIYVDYNSIAAGAYASAALSLCDAASPRQCTRARIYVTDTSPAAADPTLSDSAPSMGVFMHELGHVFGLSHFNEDDDSRVLLNPSDMWFDRATIHGEKTHASDFRANMMHAGTLGYLLAYYPDASLVGLETDEIVAHRNMSMADGATHIEFNNSKTYTDFGTATALIAELNEKKLRWNPTADVGGGVLGGFEPCSAPGTLPHWIARVSETSTNTLDRSFQAVFETTNTDLGTTWSQVATTTLHSHVAGQADLRQIDWDRTFALSAAALGVVPTGIAATTYRKLRFRADASNALAERNEANNEWEVNICLYTEANTTCSGACAQP